MNKIFSSYVYFTLSCAAIFQASSLNAFFPKKETPKETSDQKPIDPPTQASLEFVPEKQTIAVETPPSSTPVPCNSDPQAHLLYAKHIEGRGVGYQEGYSTIGLFLTPYNRFSTILPFLDLRGHVFNHGKYAANIGVGLKTLADKLYVLGAGIYYDYRQTSKQNYHQAAISFEFLAGRWECRFNGYLPFGNKNHVHRHSTLVSNNFDHFAGHNLFYSQTFKVKKRYESAMAGVDLEFGGQLFKPSKNYSLYLAGVPYYYRDHDRNTFGGKIRLQARLTPYVTLEVSNSYDHIFRNRVQGQLSLNLPFGGKIKKKNAHFTASCDEIIAMEYRMMQPLERHEIVVTEKHKKTNLKTKDPIAMSIFGGPLNIQFVNIQAVGPGNGTFENPFNSLTAASTASNFNDVFYVYPGTYNHTTAITLIQNQSLLGAGTLQNVPILVNNQPAIIQIPPQAVGIPSIINNGGSGGSVIRFNGDNNTVSGFNLTQNDNNAAIDNLFNFSYRPISNVTIINNTITQNVQHSGMFLQNISGNNTVSNNTWVTTQSKGGVAINLDEESLTIGTFTIDSNNIQGWNSAGIQLSTNTDSNNAGGAQLTAFITNNTIINNGYTDFNSANGIFLISGWQSSQNTQISNNKIQNNTGNGIVLQSQKSATLTTNVVSNNVSNNKGSGILLIPLENSTMQGSYLNNSINKNNGFGIGFNGFGDATTGVFFSALINQNTISSNSGGAMSFPASNSGNVMEMHFSITNNTLLTNGNTSGMNNSTFYLQNAPNSTTCLKLTGNTNSQNYTVQNDASSTNNPLLLEPTVNNVGQIFLVDGSGSGVFEIVEPGTCAPK